MMEAWQLISIILFVALVSSFVMAWILSKRMINVTNNLTATASASADAQGGKSGIPIMAWMAIGFAVFVVAGSLMAEQARQNAMQPASVPESAPAEVPAIAATDAAPVVPAVTALPEVAPPLTVSVSAPATMPEWLPVIVALVVLNVIALVLARGALIHAREKMKPRTWDIEPETPRGVEYLEEILDREKA